MKLKVQNIEGEFALIFSQGELAQLGLAVGDFFDAETGEDGALNLMRDRDFTKTMRIAREVMIEYRNTFLVLAKT